jgi:hypothetical protein
MNPPFRQVRGQQAVNGRVSVENTVSEKMPTSVVLAKVIAFGLPVCISSAVFRHHPDVGAVVGINLGFLCIYLVRPRQPALWIVLLAGLLASIAYLLITRL